MLHWVHLAMSGIEHWFYCQYIGNQSCIYDICRLINNAYFLGIRTRGYHQPSGKKLIKTNDSKQVSK
jgi:hypothetical protein